MSRLTEQKNGETYLKETGYKPCDDVCKSMGDYDRPCDLCPIDEAFKKLAHYENLEEQGRLIEVVTCKDCKYYKKDTSDINNPCGICEIVPCVRYENEYCSTAERKLAELKGTEE